MEQGWREYHERWESRHWLDRAMEHWEFNRKFHRKLAVHLRPGDSLLDIGSGKGYSAFCFAALGHPVTGIDTDAASVEEANEWASRLGLPARFVCDDIFSWRPNGRFRISYSMGLIEHFPREEAVRLLRIQSGCSEVVVASAPTSHSLRTVEACPVPQIPHSIGSLRRKFEEAGLQVVDSFGCGAVWSRWEGRLQEIIPSAAMHFLQNRFSYAMNAVVAGVERR